MKPIYTAEVTAKGGRDGTVKSKYGELNLQLSIPESMGGDGSAGTNPEQLFAAAYGPSFLETMKTVAKKGNIELENLKVIVKVSYNQVDKGNYKLFTAINVVEDSLDGDILRELVKKTHEVCPLSNAIRGNMEVILTANKMEVEAV